MNIDLFISELKKLEIDITDDQIEKFEQYHKLLVEWNEKMNLTNITEKEEVYLKHFYDSITMVKGIDLKGKELKLCDVGAGAGFPSIPLKIVFPNIDVTIIDALDKRIKFLNQVISDLDLVGIKALHARAEEYTKENRESFDIVTARAVARLNMLAELCIPLVKKYGYFIAMKGQHGKVEVDEAKSAISKLGCKVEEVIEFNLPIEDSIRTIVVSKKYSNTPNKYPRNFGKIKKSPL